MKTYSIQLIVLVLGSLSVLSAPAIAQTPGGPPLPVVPAAPMFVPSLMIEMRPSEKRPLLVNAIERNPYARRSPDQENVSDEGENVEEIRIRSKLSSLSVSGQSDGPNGIRLLLGDIIIERGQRLPQLFPDQNEQLQVVEVTGDKVRLGWVDAITGELTGRTMQMTYDLSPSVAYALQGQGRLVEDDSGRTPKRLMGVLRMDGKQSQPASGVATRSPVDESDSQ